MTAAQLGILSFGPDPTEVCAPDDVFEDEQTTISGRLTFDASGAWDETQNIRSDMLTVTADACLDLMGHDCSSDICTSDHGTCTCAWNDLAMSSAGGGAWQAGATAETVSLDGSEVPYCVDGDVLTVSWGGRHMVYRRQ